MFALFIFFCFIPDALHSRKLLIGAPSKSKKEYFPSSMLRALHIWPSCFPHPFPSKFSARFQSYIVELGKHTSCLRFHDGSHGTTTLWGVVVRLKYNKRPMCRGTPFSTVREILLATTPAIVTEVVVWLEELHRR
jgi:hypothetical protein